MSQPIIEVKHLSKTFGSHEVLRDVNFNVHEGDVTCVIGASGSGKSTLLRCINLLEHPTSGEILFHGAPIVGKGTDPCRYRSKVGMVFQSFNLFNNMTVLENCMTGPIKVLKRSADEAREHAMHFLEKVGMAPYIKAKPRQLSGGRSSAWPSPARWRWTRRCFCSTSPPARWTRRWSARCCPSCASWPARG